MDDVFINYRTKDEEATAATLDLYLSQRFGTDQVFRASKSIDAGQNFRKELVAAARRCHVLLAVIGPDWLTARAKDGRRALDVPEDWTRRELLEASDAAQVIPVLVGDTLRLQRSELPKALAWLADCQYRRLYHRDHNAGLQRIGDDIAELVPHLAENDRHKGEEDARDAGDVGGGNRVEGRDIGIGGVGRDFRGTYIGRSEGPLQTGNGTQHAPQISGNGANYVAGDVSGPVGGTHVAGDQTRVEGEVSGGPLITGSHFGTTGTIGSHHDNRRASEDSDR
ncbi:toll/interleukin-1 receptor domain-containing protein [Streptomyces catenulae]|uniref:Toll/interleukin-1 receptor domain-containing protein n=1 Tax=Streptomyces catenulae TaxID=66875 RepID=A0ABV2Z6R6_9ACTN|nr:toll/interleukin-1 receptor domain-containing protein [Streptomyces catenulae]